MAIERKRGCGYRKVGGIYLVADGVAEPCHRLPFPLQVCPVCNAGIKQARGWTWIRPAALFGLCDLSIPNHCSQCPCCFPPLDSHGLMWVGQKFYSPQSFMAEAKSMGVSKRVAAIPRDFKLGESWVYLGHPEAFWTLDSAASSIPKDAMAGIFAAFKPSRIELVVTQSQYDALDPEERSKKELKGYHYVVVPDDDTDHNPDAKGESDMFDENGFGLEVAHEG